MSMLSVSTAAVTVLGACLSSVWADGTAEAPQGSVVGAAMPGTMEDTFTIPFSEFDSTVPSGCGTTYAGCSGELFECPDCVPHQVNGSITVIDDCTFRIQGWQFDGKGPAVEWWGSKQDGVDELFPYPTNAIKIGELGAPGAYQLGTLHGGDSDVVVRLGKDDAGNQIEFSEDVNHISVWCEDFAVDFANTPITCDAAAPGTAPIAATPPGAPAAPEGSPATPTATPSTPSTPTAGSDSEPTDVGTPEPSAALPMRATGAIAAVGAFGLALL